MTTTLTDSYGRQIRDLRVPLTDRCNFRCFYYLPRAGQTSPPASDVLELTPETYAAPL